MSVRRSLALPLAAALAVLLPACARRPAAPAPKAAASPAPKPFTPGLGEIMALNQARHVKLWLAGDASNWPLAAYELSELREGLDDAVRYHPTQEGSPLPIKDLVPKIMDERMRNLDAAVAAKDHAAFVTAFDALTEGCNSCHQAANFGFNVVQRPASNPFPNQVFAPGGAR
jgi:hypothetical protein